VRSVYKILVGKASEISFFCKLWKSIFYLFFSVLRNGSWLLHPPVLGYFSFSRHTVCIWCCGLRPPFPIHDSDSHLPFPSLYATSNIEIGLTFLWRWGQYVSPKCLYIGPRLYDAITQKSTVWNPASVRTSKLQYSTKLQQSSEDSNHTDINWVYDDKWQLLLSFFVVYK
jgi:hypothetical protein